MPPVSASLPRAPRTGALSHFRQPFLLFCLFLGACQPAIDSRADCTAERTDLRTGVRQVHDGDTLEIADGRKVRFIGINTPELARDHKPAEPLAQEATERVRELLGEEPEVLLQTGPDKRDRYGRLLAHVFLPDGHNLSAILLREGLAVRIAIPPNLWGQECYAHAEQEARSAGRGLWPGIVVDSRQVPVGSKGFYVVRDRVERVGHSAKSVWLNFPGPFAVRIPRTALDHFRDVNLDALAGKTVEVRGWVHPGREDSLLTLRHSAMLEIVK